MNYGQIRNRFTHIDARFVECRLGFPDEESYFRVELYPWWEHPLYIEAISAGKSWGFTEEVEEGNRLVTVYPQRVIQAQMSQIVDVTDWDFTRNHPLLWPFEDAGEIFCNDVVTLEQWFRLSDIVRSRLTSYVRDENLAAFEFAHKVQAWGQSGSFSFGRLPRPLFHALDRTLTEHEIVHLAVGNPRRRRLPVLLLIDEVSYIIAEDFEIDLPEFEHKPEWFDPACEQ